MIVYLGHQLGAAGAAEDRPTVPNIEAVEAIAEDHGRRRRAATGLPGGVHQKLLVRRQEGPAYHVLDHPGQDRTGQGRAGHMAGHMTGRGRTGQHEQRGYSRCSLATNPAGAGEVVGGQVGTFRYSSTAVAQY